MKKIAQKFKPNKYIIYLYLLIPLIINAILRYPNEDIWYIMRYGKIILEKGFIHTDLLSMHQGLHIVIQQPLTCIIFHLLYKYLGNYGIFLLCEVMIALYLYIIYKICMLLSNKNTFLSIMISCITCILLEFDYISGRAQIFTFLNLLLIIYIMELFYKNNKTKLIYVLPLISLLQINFHAALWYFQFAFMLPYLFQMIIEKNKNAIKIIIIMIVMFLVGFINPYTYENVFFPFITYDSQINNYIEELYPISIASKDIIITIISIMFYILLSIIILIFIYYKKGKLELRHLLLFAGTTLLSLANNRSIPIFIIGSIPPLSSYLKNMKFRLKNEYVDTKKVWIIMIILILLLAKVNPNRLVSEIKNGGDFLNNNYDKNIVLYTNIYTGPYLEYLGFHPYFDTRAEVFTKKANKKEEIFIEAMMIQKNCINYKEFIKKYNFTHYIVKKNSCLYNKLLNEQMKIIYKDKDCVIFEKVNKKEK